MASKRPKLSGKIQNTISTNPNYTISGFSSRISTSNPNTQLGRGLFPIGTNVSNPDNVFLKILQKEATALMVELFIVINHIRMELNFLIH